MLRSLRRKLQKKREKSKLQTRNKMRFEALEPRILLSADLGIEYPITQIDSTQDNPSTQATELHDSVLDDNQEQVEAEPSTSVENLETPVIDSKEQPLPILETSPGSKQNSIENEQSVQNESVVAEILGQETKESQLIIVDTSLVEYGELVSEIQSQQNDGVFYEIALLDETNDGLTQISSILEEKSDLSGIHVLSHGSAGSLIFGNGVLDQSTLDERTSEVTLWGNALTEDGDILLYGCNIAGGESGVNFVESLAKLTGADVAASDDTTGAAPLGGDWTFEYATGTVEARPIYDKSSYSYRLAEVVVTGTGSSDIITVDMENREITVGTTTSSFFNGDRLRLDGNGASDTLVLYGTAGDDTFSIDGANHRIYHNSTTEIDYSGFAKLRIDGGMGNDHLVVGSEVIFTEGISLTAELINVNADINTGSGSMTFTAAAVDDRMLSNTLARINITNAALSGGEMTFSASSSVTAKSNGLLNLPGAEVALITANSDVGISISGSSQLVSTGDVTLTAESTVKATAKALANTNNIDTEVDAAVATSTIDSTAFVHVGDTATLSVTGALSMKATNTRNVTTIADGSAGGAGGSVAVAVITGDTKVFIDGNASILEAASVNLMANKLDNIKTEAKAATGGASKSTTSTTATEKQLSDYKAETSEGPITFAAAVAISDINDSNTLAYLDSDQSITTAGQLSISSFDNTDESSLADGSSVGAASVGIGAAVAINLADVNNEAYVDGLGPISAGSLVVQTSLAPEGSDDDIAQDFTAEAISGASATMSAIAGSLALNIMDAKSLALIKTGSDVTITDDGDARLSAENNTVSSAIAKPVGEGAVAGTVGVGASVALNIANTETIAELEDNSV
ncbi:MAG: DUF4347 domain-containing protein, partial [Desulfobulbaceae bacterium]|nr:DUF4347 domain-containing protein [Desulfobulbaceae bacterium]